MTETELLLTHVRGCERIDLYTDRRPLTEREERQFESLRVRLSQGEPLQYLLGSWDFCGLTLKVDPRVLIPRPETELLAEAAIEQGRKRKVSKILDLGTGSGNLAIVLAKAFPGASVTAVDISGDALDVARDNARTHGVEDRLSFCCEDMLSFLKKGEAYDLIVANPPYVPESQMASLPKDVQQEPSLALNGGPDGMRFLCGILELIRAGILFMEIGDGQRNLLKEWAGRVVPDVHLEFLRDHSGKDRIVYGKIDH